MNTFKLLLTVIFGSLVGAAGTANKCNAQVAAASPTLSDLIDADSEKSNAGIVKAATSGSAPAGSVDSGGAEEASSTIEPLPPQGTLFGRLRVEQSKLPDDDFQFYSTTPKQVEGTRRTREVWSDEVFTWAATNFYHQPLYFEEPNLERYGVGPHRILHGPISAAHFFTNIAVLPYHVASAPPRTRHYALGHYRPGDCVPYRFHRAPFSVKGFVAQGAAAAGIVLIP